MRPLYRPYALAWWSDSGPATRTALNATITQGQLAADGLVVLQTGSFDVELRTPADAHVVDLKGPGERRRLTYETVLHVPGGWLTSWEAVGEDRLIRFINTDGSERWRVSTWDEASQDAAHLVGLR